MFDFLNERNKTKEKKETTIEMNAGMKYYQALSQSKQIELNCEFDDLLVSDPQFNYSEDEFFDWIYDNFLM